MESHARSCRFEVGETLLAQGEIAVGLFVIVSGRVKVWRAAENGAALTLTLLGPGQPIGVLGVVDRRVNHASATATTLVEALAWRMTELRPLMDRSVTLTGNVLRTVTHYAEQFIERLEEVSSVPVERRIARTLLRMAPRVEAVPPVDGCVLRLSRQDIAELTSATLPTVSRFMSLWRRNRWIAGTRGQVTLLDCAALRRVAGWEER